jgi:hypothetical protein
MSHLLHMIFIFLLNCVLLFLHQHVGLSTSDDNMRDDDSDFGLDQHATSCVGDIAEDFLGTEGSVIWTTLNLVLRKAKLVQIKKYKQEETRLPK